MTVSFLLCKYALSSSSSLLFCSSRLTRSFSSFRALRPASKASLRSARAREAFPGVWPRTGSVLTRPTDIAVFALWSFEWATPLKRGGCRGRGAAGIDAEASKTLRRLARSRARSGVLTRTGAAAAEAPFPGGGRRASAAAAKADVDVGFAVTVGARAPSLGTGGLRAGAGAAEEPLSCANAGMR